MYASIYERQTLMTDFNAKFTELNTLLSSAHKSAERLKGGVKCESARCRADLQGMTKIIAQLKRDVLDHAKSLPTKTRVKKAVAVIEKKTEAVPETKTIANKENVPPPEVKQNDTPVNRRRSRVRNRPENTK